MFNRWKTFVKATLLVSTATLLMGAARKVDNLPTNPLRGPEGVTSLSGQVVDLQGHGLARVDISVGTSNTQTNDEGQFLLTYVIPGKTILQIDGRRAGRGRDADHGFYQVQVNALAGKTTILPFKNWLPRIDHANDVTIASPTQSPVVVRNPQIPDFELRIPPGVVIRDIDGKIVTRVGITPVPPDRTPFPLPDHINIPIYFTIQPGAACLYDAAGGVGTASIVFPNFGHDLPKARAILWRYEPDANGWTTYGMGTVGADGRQIIPAADAVITDFYGSECDSAQKTRKPLAERPRSLQQMRKMP